MKKSSEIVGLSIISIQEGKQIGIVKQLIIDAAAKSVAALIIDDGNWYMGAKALPFTAITGIGEYAVTTNSEKDVAAISAYDRLLAEDVQVIGATVVTNHGNVLGTVAEVTIEADGKIAECFIKNAEDICSAPSQQIITYGKELIIIATEPVQSQFNDPAAAFANENVAAPVDNPPANVDNPPANQIDPVAQYLTTNSHSQVAEYPAVNPVSQNDENSNMNQDDTQETSSTDKPSETEPDALAKLFEEKQRQYMLGKRASRRIEAENGAVIIEQGDEITETVLENAKQAGKFVELSMSIF